jgi:hypothetical protein
VNTVARVTALPIAVCVAIAVAALLVILAMVAGGIVFVLVSLIVLVA